MAKLSETEIQEAMRLVVSNQNEWFIDELGRSISETLTKARGDESGQIESAVSLTDLEKQTLHNFLAKLFKRKINLNFSLKLSLLGGLKISVGDWKLDCSLDNQLMQLQRFLGGST